MSMPRDGLIKLMEECGELIQAAAKVISMEDGNEMGAPDAEILQNFSDECSDVLAIIGFVFETRKVNLDPVEQRVNTKLARYKKWSNELPIKK